MNELKSQYLESFTKLELARRNAQAMSEVIAKAGTALGRDWRSVMVLNVTAPGVEANANYQRANYEIDARQWPDARTLHNAIAAWHNAWADAATIWGQLSEQDRIGLEPLPQNPANPLVR